MIIKYKEKSSKREKWRERESFPRESRSRMLVLVSEEICARVTNRNKRLRKEVKKREKYIEKIQENKRVQWRHIKRYSGRCGIVIEIMFQTFVVLCEHDFWLFVALCFCLRMPVCAAVYASKVVWVHFRGCLCCYFGGWACLSVWEFVCVTSAKETEMMFTLFYEYFCMSFTFASLIL